MEILVDSSLLVSLFNSEDRQHRRAILRIGRLSGEETCVLIHPLVFIETLSVLKYKAKKIELKETRKVLEDKKRFKKIEEGISVDEGAIEIFERYEKIGMIDAILIQEAIRNGWELVTFDKKMEEVWKRLKRRK